MTRKPLVHDRQLALYLGVGAYIAGTLLLWDAFENRGKGRPRGLKVFDAARGLL